jgi:hypothetical protein
MSLETRKTNANQEASATRRLPTSIRRHSKSSTSSPTDPVKVSSPLTKAKPPLTPDLISSGTANEPSDTALRRPGFGTKKKSIGPQKNPGSFSQAAICRTDDDPSATVSPHQSSETVDAAQQCCQQQITGAFVSTKEFVRIVTRRLKRALRARGYDPYHMDCVNLVCRLHGWQHYTDFFYYAHYHELDRFNEFCSDEIVATRHDFHMEVMQDLGFAATEAEEILDEIAPTGW